jgi:hypothetical protein
MQTNYKLGRTVFRVQTTLFKQELDLASKEELATIIFCWLLISHNHK